MEISPARQAGRARARKHEPLTTVRSTSKKAAARRARGAGVTAGRRTTWGAGRVAAEISSW